MSTTPVPTIGRVVLYMLSEDDAAQINRRRTDAAASRIATQQTGAVVHVGNSVTSGEVYPMIVVRVWDTGPDAACNGQVLLDGNDSFWASSVSFGEGPRHFVWPQISKPAPV